MSRSLRLYQHCLTQPRSPRLILWPPVNLLLRFNEAHTGLNPCLDAPVCLSQEGAAFSCQAKGFKEQRTGAGAIGGAIPGQQDLF